MRLLNSFVKFIFTCLILFSAPVLAQSTPNPNTDEILKLKAKAEQKYENKNFAAALVDYLEIVKKGGDPTFLYNVALCYKQMGDLYNALKYFEQYAKEDPDSDYAAAAKEQALKIDKDIKGGKGTLTPTQKNARKYNDKANKLYEEALSASKTNIDKAHSLFDEAAKNYILSYNQESDISKLYNVAQAYRLAGNEPEATSYYTKYIEAANKNEKYKSTKGFIDNAKKYLETLQSISQDNFDRLPEIPLPPLPASLEDLDPPRRKWPWIVAGAGVALLAGGAIVILSAR